MTRDEAQKEYEKFLNDLVDEEEAAFKKAKAEGKIGSGLDGSWEFGRIYKEKWKKKVQELRASIDE